MPVTIVTIYIYIYIPACVWSDGNNNGGFYNSVDLWTITKVNNKTKTNTTTFQFLWISCSFSRSPYGIIVMMMMVMVKVVIVINYCLLACWRESQVASYLNNTIYFTNYKQDTYATKTNSQTKRFVCINNANYVI